MIDEKESDKRDQVGEKEEEILNTYIELLKLRKFISMIDIENITKQSYESNQIDISDDKDSDERDQIGENDEDRLTDHMEVLEQGKLSSQKNIDNIEKWYDESNRIDIIDDKDSNERYQIGENEKDISSNVIDVLELGKLSSQKNIENIENESDKSGQIDIIDEEESDERYQIRGIQKNELY